MKSTKKIADRTRHSQNCNFFADGCFCKRGLEAKNARGCSHRLFLEGARSGHIAKRTSNGATRANENYKNGFHKRRLGVKKVRFLFEDGRSRFSEMCFPPRAGSTFLQKIGKINDVMQRCMQNAFCNLHIRCKIASRSVVDKFFAFRSASAERNENHKNQPDDGFEAAGRNARGRWGKIRWGFEICRFEICNFGLVTSIRHASTCHTARAADSIAPRIPPGQDEGRGRGKIEEG